MCDGFALEIDLDALHAHVFDLETLVYDLQTKLERIERALRYGFDRNREVFTTADRILSVLNEG